MTRFLIVPVLVALCSGAAGAAEEIRNPLAESFTWEDMASDILGEVVPAPADGVMTVAAPYRADDAATVPIRMTQPNDAPAIDTLTLVVDENPAPVAAEIAFGEAMMPLDFEMRVRVDQYSNVRAIATTEDGETLMTGRFVKASGGCSAPASRSPEEALAGLGEMRLREFGATGDGRQEAQVMIRHPMFSGLQRDQITQLRVPAHFIDRLEVYQGDELLFTLTGGISVSENPVFRFRYHDNGAPEFRVRAVDTEGYIFQQVLPKTAAS